MRLPTLALAALAFCCPGIALAVDLPPAPVLDDEEEALGSGWYLRGDAGGADPSISRHSRDLGSVGFSSLFNGRLERGVTASVGLGYQASPWFRAEVAVDHRFAASFRGARFASNGTNALDRGEAQATSIFLNGYVDLPLWDGITPYLGAGIGVSRVRFADYEREVTGPSGLIATAGLRSETETVLAWTLMGGVAFDLTRNLKVDLGYRYSRLNGSDFDREAAIRPGQINAHEFRIGARYLFD